MKASKTSLNCNKIGNLSMTLVLDKRTNKNTEKYPMAICFNIDRTRWYYKLVDMPFQTETFFNSVCSVSSSRSRLMDIHDQWQQLLEGYREKVVKLSKSRPITLDNIKTMLSGAGFEEENDFSFLGVWEGLINKYKRENRVGTADNYSWSLNSFRKIIGEVNGFKIDKNTIKLWDEGMRNGIMLNGKLEGKISDANRGMYLRTCRVVWNECIKRGYLPEESYPFSNKDNDLVSIPRGKKRQQSYLTIEEMTQLYHVFTEKRYPETWTKEYTERAHDSLGLFLTQYLCNGFNLADAGRLKFNRTYFAEGGRAFEFLRKKTSETSNGMSVVIVPIIKPLQVILDEIGAKPAKDAYVFPQIFRGIEDETIRRKLTVQENSNIKDRVIRICKEVLGWEKKPSGTWARHSFATNLKHLGVEELYISESMGHSLGNNITAGYQDMYPLETRFEYNSKLLNLEEEKPDIDVDSMTPEQMKEMLKKVLGQK